MRLRAATLDFALIRSSSVVFAGFSVARLLGFLFSLVAAHVLSPSGFGQMSYVLALATIASVLLSSAPAGLSRFLARYAGDAGEQEAYLTNWLAVVGGLFVLSLFAAIPLCIASRLDLWMSVGLATNLAGIAVLETYREVQRGLGRFAAMTAFYSLANLLQLAAVVVVVLLGWRSPVLFVMIYGSSTLVAWLAMERIAPVRLRFTRMALARRRMVAVLRFAAPLLWQSVFYAVWFSADLLFVQWIMQPAATGNYAAAKTLANALWLAPTAIGMALVPRVARLAEHELRGYVGGVLALTLVVTLCGTGLMVIFARPLLHIAFGDRYPDAALPMGLIAAGMGLHGIYLILFNVWIGLGRPRVNMASAAAGMVCTVVAAPLLIPSYGLLGAALAFALGSGARLLVIGGFSTRVLWFEPRVTPAARVADTRV